MFLIDTGASTSLLAVKFADTSDLHLGPPKTREMWNGSSETSCGTAKLPVTSPVTTSITTCTLTLWLATTSSSLE